MKVSIKKWGNSIGIRIPATYAHILKLDVGSTMELSQIENGMKLIPLKKNRREELEELLSQITPENMHHEDFFGKNIGKEIL